MDELPDLPRDAILNIFSRVPPRNIMQSKLLDREWADEIDSPYFVRLHLQNCTEYGFISRYSHELSISRNHLYMMSFTRFEINDVVGFTNFIVCFVDGMLISTDSSSRHICVCNPSTHCYTLITPYNVNFERIRTYKHVAVGAAFDHITESYKIVRILTYTRELKQDRMSIIEIYNCTAHLWNHQETNLPFLLNKSCDLSIQCFAYWNMPRERVIVAFDMSTDSFSSIVLPEELLIDSQAHKALEYNNQLALISFLNPRGKRMSGVSLWTYQNAEWSKLFVIPIHSDYFVQDALPGGHIILQKTRDPFTTIYSIGTNEYKRVRVMKDSALYCYKQTLASIQGFIRY